MELRFDTQQVIDVLCKKFNPAFGGLDGWSCEVDVRYVIIKHKDFTFRIQIKAHIQSITIETFVGKTLHIKRNYNFVGFDTFKDYMKYITDYIQKLEK